MTSVQELESKVAQRIFSAGWKELTPIQRKALPVLLRRKNALLVAPTGSGKTEAAVIPIFASLSAANDGQKGVRALYITPLRALNRDILRRILNYAKEEGLSADIRHGDTPTAARRKISQRPPDVLITTPETLAILLSSRNLRTHFSNLEWIVVDELHELLSSERGAHLAVGMERLQSLSTKEVVRVGLSATVGNLEEASRFLSGSNRPCAILVDNSIRVYNLHCLHIDGPVTELAEKILQRAPPASGSAILVFTNTRDDAEYVASAIKAKSPETPLEIHHGSLSREVREEAETKLRRGEAGIVVSTSSLELGLDIGAIGEVIQISSPRQATKLVQRVGRSRHRVGESAVGLIMTNRLDDELESMALIDRVTRNSLEPTKIHQNSLDVLAHHVAGMALEKMYLTVDEILATLKKSYPFRTISREDIDASLRVLERHGILRYDGELIRRRAPKTYEYYFKNISMIPEVQQFEVIDITVKKTIGRLDQMFVGEYGELGKQFTLKGTCWKIISVDDNERLVHVEPVPHQMTAIPYWVGELIPVDFDTTQQVGIMRRRIANGVANSVSEKQRETIRSTVRLLGVVPDDRSVVIERSTKANTIVLHCCFGTKVNQTLASLLATILSSKIGYLVEAKSDAYRIVISSSVRLAPNLLIDVLRSDFVLEDVLGAGAVGTHAINWKTWHVAKRFGLIARDSKYDRRASRLIQERQRETPVYREVLRELFLEKYHVENTRRVLLRVREGKIRIYTCDVEEFSPLARPILDYVSSFAALPLTVEKAVIELVRGRLGKVRHRLVCLICGNWETVIRTNDVGEVISCPVCKSRLIADTFVGDEELRKIVRKKLKGVQLGKEEQRKFLAAWKTSSLIENFGKKAVVVLSGYGLGPDTAARVLRSSPDDEQLLRNVYKAEKNYVRTRGFWD